METFWIIVGSMPQQVDQLSLPEVWKHAGSLWQVSRACQPQTSSLRLLIHLHNVAVRLLACILLVQSVR